VHQAQEAKRKKWRPLGQFRIPTTFSKGGFENMVAVGLVEAFKAREPVEFVAIAHYSEAQGLSVYSLASPYIELTDTMNNRCQRLVTEALDPNLDKEEAKARYSAEEKAIFEGYHVTGGINLDLPMNCVRMTCDPRTRTAHFATFKPRSTRPQDYPDKLEHTSELLEYIAALYGSSRSLIVDLGDPFYLRTYRWAKFMARFIEDRAVDLGRIRANDLDPEDWDFVNTELDYELATAPKA
jgi:hypothetical protein